MFWCFKVVLLFIYTASDVDADDILQVQAVHALSALFTACAKKERKICRS